MAERAPVSPGGQQEQAMVAKIVRRLLVGVGLLAGVTVLGAYLVLRGSLPILDGGVTLDGLLAEVIVSRDEQGAPTLVAQDQVDLMYALGFVHAQDRFFQMDLSRRLAAGELAALVGKAALATDKANRLHGFRSLAKAIWKGMDPGQQRTLLAYSEGVNQGLALLDSRPFEYWLLGVRPQPWLPEDSMLVLYSMYMMLQDDTGAREAQRIAIRGFYPPAMAEFLEPAGSSWDAPLLGEGGSAPELPLAADYDIRRVQLAYAPARERAEWDESQPELGSNNWAVAGWRSGTGKSLLANDMHLGIRVPNTWYRAWLRVTGRSSVSGVTLPGVPGVVAGSNGRVAWGFTNSYGDWVDLVALEFDPLDAGRYRTPEGYESLATRIERIQVRGQEPVEHPVEMTRWGPVVEYLGKRYALAWTAHYPEAANLGLLGLEQASTVEQALAQANRVGAPAQNFVAADDQGNIGWTIMGRIPRRTGYQGWQAADWSQPGTGWQGWIEPSAYPRVINPESGIIWTANSRVVDGDMLGMIGDGGFALGARAGQIRDDLMALEAPDVDDMLAVQLDDRALFLERWRNVLLELLTEQALQEHPRRAQFRELVEHWVPRASVDSVGYRLVRGFRQQLLEDVYASLTGELRQAYPDLVIRPSWQFEDSLWLLVTRKPSHLLESRFASWEQQMLAVVDWLIDDYASRFEGGLAQRSWGERNTAEIEHPLSGALPVLGELLNMPRQPLPGDANMPRVQGMRFGASERFALSPGDEASGYFHMPGGQSGHPLSDYYRRGHDAWAQGRPSSFLPQAGSHQLVLRPRQR